MLSTAGTALEAKMKSRYLLGCAFLFVSGAAATAIAQSGNRPTATYWMSADTTSGFAGAMAGGGDPGAMVRALMGGGGNAASHAHGLTLQLGGSQRPTGTPGAEHLPPAGLGAGQALPLLSPEPSRAAPPPEREWHGMPARPRGRLLIYWGCGERARPGQPVEIDFSRLAAGQVPPGFASANFRTMNPPSAGSHPTYGEWPNRQARTAVPPTGSLVGEHVVRGNYAPEIRFTLGQGQDFLPPLQLTSNSAAPAGSVPLAWRPVAGARAYFLTAMGAARNDTMVIWTSSESQMPAMGMMDYLPQDEIVRLVRERVLLSPETRQCTVPAEVASAVEGAMLSVTAFGPEANFSHPARPANAPASWTPEWTVKLRTRSMHMGMLGMDMGQMMGGQEEAAPQGQGQQPPRRRSLRDRLRDAIDPR
jgi:hypothetical protein